MTESPKSWRQEQIEAKPKIAELTLSAMELRRLFTICIELIDLCSKVFGKIDPQSAISLLMHETMCLSKRLTFGHRTVA